MGSRARSRPSGSTKASGSRLAAPNSSATSSPRGISTPSTSIGSRTQRSNSDSGRVVPQELLDRGRQEVRLGSQPGQRVGMAEERPPAVPRAVDRGLVTRVQEQDAGPDQLGLGQRVAVVDDRGEGADQVVARPAAPFGEQVAQVRPELDAGLDGLARRRLRRVQLVHQAEVGRPGSEEVAVRGRDAQQLGDDRHGQRLHELGDEVGLPGLAHVVDQAVDDGLDPAPHRLHGPWRERLEDQPSEPRVIGRLEIQHAHVVQLVERPMPGGRLGPAHLRVGRLMEIRPAEPAVAQEPVDVGVPRDEPLVGGGVPQDRMLGLQPSVDRVRIRDEPGVRGIEPELQGRHGDGRTGHASKPSAGVPGTMPATRSTAPCQRSCSGLPPAAPYR